MTIPYDQLLGVHSLTAILAEAAKYQANHGGAKFVRPFRLPLYDKNIANDATTNVCVHAKATQNPTLTTMQATKQPNVASPSFPRRL
jgi:hypothetical protein